MRPSPSHTAKLQHGGGEIKHLAQTAPRGPRFLLHRRCSALIVNRLAANGLSFFSLAPLLLRLRLALCLVLK